MTADPYSRVDYRRFVAWPRRIERERPLLEKVLRAAPSRRILDLGCGSGEHARFLVAEGFEVLGIDSSESMLAAARERPLPDGLEFRLGRIEELERLTARRFGGAICLGNTLPHLRTEKALAGLLEGLARRLLPAGVLLLQLLNYQRIGDRGIRQLPLDFRDADGTEIVFLRLMTPRADGTVVFCPSTLSLDPASDSPLEVRSSKRIELRGWRPAELEEHLERAGFSHRRLLAGFDERPFDAAESHDLIVVARV